MSVQIALGAPATRVASRNDGPVAGSRSPPSVAAACATSTLASTCGRCETDASIRSWASASIAVGSRAERDQQAMQALVQLAGGLHAGRQVPDGAVEQVGAGVRDARPSRRPPAGGRRRTEDRRERRRPRAWSSRHRSPRSPAERTQAPRRRGRRAARPAPRRTPPRRRKRRWRRPRTPRRRRRGRSLRQAPPPRRRSRSPWHSARDRAASATEPPISPTPSTATRMPP